jgi:uncharacterized protein YoxC
MSGEATWIIGGGGLMMAVIVNVVAVVWAIARLRGNVDELKHIVVDGLKSRVETMANDTSSITTDLRLLREWMNTTSSTIATLGNQMSAMEATCRERGRKGAEGCG